MPIKGLTDRGMSFPEIGVIRKGKKEQKQRADGSTYEVPVDLSYFRIDLDAKETEAIERFRKAYGDEPDEINILLPFDEIERCWDAWLEAYTAGRMVARSDGEYFSYLIDLETGEIIVKDGLNVTTGQLEPHREVIGKAGKSVIKCKPNGRLKVIVPELRRLAYVTVKTTSYLDCGNIGRQLRALKSISGGILKGIPLVLRRRPKMISTPGQDGQRVRREKWLISIEADPKWAQPKFEEAMRLAMPSGAEYDVLELPEYIEDEDDVIEVTAIEDVDAPVETSAPDHGLKFFPVATKRAIVEANMAQDALHAAEMLDKSNLPQDVEPEIAVRWVRKYTGENGNAEKANAAYTAYLEGQN